MKTYRAAFIGFAHVHAPGFMAMFSQHPQVQLAACADLPPSAPSLSAEEGTRGSNLALAEDAYEMKRYAGAEALFKNEKIDIVLSCAENSRHGEVVRMAAEHGCHCLLEKPMATSFDMAEDMAKRMRAAGRTLVVNWPTTWDASLRAAEALVRKGAIGRVLKFRYMNSSSLGPFSYGQDMTDAEKAAEWWYRPEDGGGAFFDYCGYGCMLSTWLIGSRAREAMALKANLTSPFASADDNGMILARFPEALATVEGTWSVLNGGVHIPYVVYGSEGTLVAGGESVDIYRSRFGYEPDERHEVPPLPEDRDNLAKEMIHCLDTGDALHPTLDLPLNLDAMALLDAGLRSAQSGRLEAVR
jgi:predicted dehydrogenase